VDEMLTLVSTGIGMAITCSTVAEKHQWPNWAFVLIEDLEPVNICLAYLRSECRAAGLSMLETFIDVIASRSET
jgi:hypothetical protein